MSFPSDPEEAKKNETLSNVILNALTIYQVKNRREIFIVQNVAQKILNGGDTFELDEDDIAFLSRALYQATVKQDEKDQAPGIYTSVVMRQVFEALEIKE